jgi:signal transduction histidine kinase
MTKAERGEEKERLIELLIHDLAGFLAVASVSMTSLLQKPEQYGALTDAQRRVAERIDRNIGRAQALLHEMIEVVRANEGIFKSEMFDVGKVLQEAVTDAFGAEIEHQEHARRAEGDEKALEALGVFIEVNGKYRDAAFCHDARKIAQILRNLIGNALKFRRSKVRIAVHGEHDLVMTVEDDGLGIREDAAEVLFKRFSRVTDEGQRAIPGFGLGLFGVKSLVEAMGGGIDLTSKQGAGTCFTVRIPPLPSGR